MNSIEMSAQAPCHLIDLLQLQYRIQKCNLIAQYQIFSANQVNYIGLLMGKLKQLHAKDIGSEQFRCLCQYL